MTTTTPATTKSKRVTYHLVSSQGPYILGVFGASGLTEAQAYAKRIEGETGYPAFVGQVVTATRPRVGQLHETVVLFAQVERRTLLKRLVWKHTHRDFKGKFEDGSKSLLVGSPHGGSALVPLDSLSDEDLLARLPARVRETENV